MRLARLNEHPEVFYSLQGEGASIGMPAVFVRLYGCNLSCEWCDTAYSWNQEIGGIMVEPAELAELVRQYPCKHIVLTGGEPLIQQKKLAGFFDQLEDYYIEVETNGTIQPDENVDAYIGQYNISPKLHHSGNAPEAALRQDVLSCFAHELGEKSWFKFVIATEADITLVLALMEKCGIRRDRVILMPLAATKQQLEERRQAVAELAIKYGLRFSDRLHITLWGNKKGV